MRGCLSVIVPGALGLRLTSLAVTSSGIELHGSLDVGALLR
ncbi:MAG: hypothetical protein ACXWXR_08905 [Candidatus Limnocylindrales bacterium]